MESNKLIAEFMGMELEHDMVWLHERLHKDLIRGRDYYEYSDTKNVEDCDGLSWNYVLVDTEYHKNWVWLMKVVEKIEDIRFTFKGNEDRIPRYSVRVENYLVDIIDNYTSEEILHIEGDDRRDATYKAVVEFIKKMSKEEFNGVYQCPVCDCHNTEAQHEFTHMSECNACGSEWITETGEVTFDAYEDE